MYDSRQNDYDIKAFVGNLTAVFNRISPILQEWVIVVFTGD